MLTRELTPEIANAVNELVEAGGKIALSIHDLPVDAFAQAKRVRVWPAKDGRAPYLSGDIEVEGCLIDLYSEDITKPAEAPAEETELAPLHEVLS